VRGQGTDLREDDEDCATGWPGTAFVTQNFGRCLADPESPEWRLGRTPDASAWEQVRRSPTPRTLVDRDSTRVDVERTLMTAG